MEINKIQNPDFLKDLSIKEMKSLCFDIRKFLLENVSKTGGHLSSNLGTVELEVAMHYVFNPPKDKFIFDVGHQCYTHKILTGRAKEFNSLRQDNGLSGFINKSESIYDVWESGHSSTSISAQCGFLLSQGLNCKDRVVVLIGDASIANGVALEALNYMGDIKGVKPIIILNDNEMSISRSVGSASRSLSKLRSTRAYQKINNFLVKITPSWLKKFFHRVKNSIKGLILKENIFEDWGYDYMGPYNGNDLKVCIKTLKAIKNLNKPCVVHFVTKKGKGYKPAEEDKDGLYHSTGPFDLSTGINTNKIINDDFSYSEVFAHKIEQLLAISPHYVIVPAMIQGCALTKLKKLFPYNILDVGIAEEHAAVMASAMAQEGKKVFLMLYSTFSQRAFDYILNDIARNDTHVIIGIDRADIVEGDGSTHQGIYDVCMFNMMPNIQIVMPKDGYELLSLIDYGENINHPIVIRYPKSKVIMKNFFSLEAITKPSWTTFNNGQDIIIITYGENLNYIKNIVEKHKIDALIVNARFIKPIDEDFMRDLIQMKRPILIYENCVQNGSLSANIMEFLHKNNYFNVMIKSMGFECQDIISHSDNENIKKKFHLSEEDILENINYLINNSHQQI